MRCAKRVSTVELERNSWVTNTQRGLKKKALEVQSPDDCDSPKPSRISVNTAKNNLLTTRRREACCTNRFKTEVLWRTGLNKNILALVKTVKDPPLTFSKSRVPLKPPRNRKSSFWKYPHALFMAWLLPLACSCAMAYLPSHSRIH